MIFHDILDDQRFACLTMMPDVRRKVGGDDQENDDDEKNAGLDAIELRRFNQRRFLPNEDGE